MSKEEAFRRIQDIEDRLLKERDDLKADLTRKIDTFKQLKEEVAQAVDQLLKFRKEADLQRIRYTELEAETSKLHIMAKNYEQLDHLLSTIVNNSLQSKWEALMQQVEALIERKLIVHDKIIGQVQPLEIVEMGPMTDQQITLTHIHTQIKVQKPVKQVEIKTDTVKGKILYLYSQGMFRGKTKPKVISAACMEKWGTYNAAVSQALNELASDGILVKGTISDKDSHLVYWLAEGVEFQSNENHR